MLKKLFASKRKRNSQGRKAVRSASSRAQGHRERLTIMLVPAEAWGKPLQFQMKKRTLLFAVGIFVVSVLAVPAVIGYHMVSNHYRGKRKLSGEELRRATLEQETELNRLRERNQQLSNSLRSQVKATQDRITQVNRLVGRISDLYGWPLDIPTSETMALTSGSALVRYYDDMGRGGPLSPSLDSSAETLLGHGMRSYVQIRDMQSFQLDSLIMRLERAAEFMTAQEKILETTPLICPVQGEYMVTDRFGERKHPLYGMREFHKGLDLGAAYGTPIIAPADGVVSFAGYDKAMGRTLTIEHGEGLFPEDGEATQKEIRTRYFHCAKVLLKKGAKVKRGDVIALVGSTGMSTGNHLHYEVLVDDEQVDPEYFILNLR